MRTIPECLSRQRTLDNETEVKAPRPLEFCSGVSGGIIGTGRYGPCESNPHSFLSEVAERFKALA
jgi:hypothetical protein